MQAIRRARLQAEIQEQVSMLVMRNIKDPRILPLTISNVEVTEDAEHAVIFFMLLGGGTDDAVNNCKKGLTSAVPFLRRHLAKSLKLRIIPTLAFKEDRGLENAKRVHDLLKVIAKESGSQDDPESKSKS